MYAKSCQKEPSPLTDIYHSDISQIENQKLMLKDFEIIAFCKVLGVTYDQLFEDTDNIFD